MQSESRWRSLATSHRDGEEREDKTQTGLLSDIYIVSCPWDKSPFLTIIPVRRILGFCEAVWGAMRLVSESWFVSISVVWESPFCYNRVRLVI